MIARQKKKRINKAGGGREDKIGSEEQIILTLIYLRHHLNFQLLGLIFKVSEITAHKIFNKNLLESALPASLLEQVKKSEENLELIQKILCGLVRLRIGSLIIKQKKNLPTGETIDVFLAHIFSPQLSFH